MKKTPEVKMLSPEETDSLLIRAAAGTLTPEDITIIRQTFYTLVYIFGLLHQKNAQVKTLLKRIFGIKSEKTQKVQQQLKAKNSEEQSDSALESNKGDMDDDGHDKETESTTPEKPKKRKGHGRLGVDAFIGAEEQKIFHETLKPKDLCPECEEGKVYEMNEPGVLIGFSGRPPVMAEITRLQKLRCNLCGTIFTAELPRELKDKEIKGGRYYDPTAGSMMAILRYGSGMPLNRLSALQKHLGIPLAASTIWDKIKATAALILPVFEALLQLAAQGRIIHNDDTGVKI